MSERLHMDRTHVTVSNLQSQGTESLMTDAKPAELMSLVWQFTTDAWAFMEPAVAKLPFQRNVVRVVRSGR